MKPKVKKLFVALSIMVLLLLLAAMGLNYSIEDKIKEQIKQAPENVKLHFEDIEVNSFKGSVRFAKLFISVYDTTSHKLSTQIELNHLDLESFSYWNYFVNGKIKLGQILLSQPIITYYQNDKVKSESFEEKLNKAVKQIIEIESFNMENAQLAVYNFNNDSLLLKSEGLSLTIDAIELHPSGESNPIAYKDFNFTSNSFFYRVNEYENLFLKSLDISSDYSKLVGLTFKTKYSQEGLSKRIAIERNHFDLFIDSIELKEQHFGFGQDSIFYFKSERLDIHQPIFTVYKDKLVADNLKYQPLYSKALRNLNFDLTVNSTFINNATITYIEKVKPDTKGGVLLFTNLNAEIKNIDNTYAKGEKVTSAKVTTIFMDNTHADVDWEFDINNPNDEFLFKAQLGKLSAKSMNQFMEPNLNVRLEGEIDKTYFTIFGNDINSQIDLKMKYENFDVHILRDNGKEKNKFLSNLINIFVSDGSGSTEENYRHGSKKGVERAQHKSTFNFIWLSIRAGLLNAMTGKGKKNN